MGSRIINNKESLMVFLKGGHMQLILKSQVIGIVISGQEKVRIDTLFPSKCVTLHFAEVVHPLCHSVFELAKTVTSMVDEIKIKQRQAA